MILTLALAVGIALVPMSGGSLGRLKTTNLNASGFLPFGLALQMIVPGVISSHPRLTAPGALVTLAWILGAALLLWFCVKNYKLHGLTVAGFGILLNALAILLNRGMPVGSDALALLKGAGEALRAVQSSALYNLQNEGTRALVLADVLPLPGPHAFRSVVSLGDLLLLSGIVAAIVQMGARSLADPGDSV